MPVLDPRSQLERPVCCGNHPAVGFQVKPSSNNLDLATYSNNGASKQRKNARTAPPAANTVVAKPTSIKKPTIIRPHQPERWVAPGPRIDPAVRSGAQSNPVSRSQVSDTVPTGSRPITAHAQPSMSFQHRRPNPALATAGSGPCNGGLLAATSLELQKPWASRIVPGRISVPPPMARNPAPKPPAITGLAASKPRVRGTIPSYARPTGGSKEARAPMQGERIELDRWRAKTADLLAPPTTNNNNKKNSSVISSRTVSYRKRGAGQRELQHQRFSISHR